MTGQLRPMSETALSMMTRSLKTPPSMKIVSPGAASSIRCWREPAGSDGATCASARASGRAAPPPAAPRGQTLLTPPPPRPPPRARDHPDRWCQESDDERRQHHRVEADLE